MENVESKAEKLTDKELETVVGGLSQVIPREDADKYGGDMDFQRWDQQEYLAGQEKIFNKKFGDSWK